MLSHTYDSTAMCTCATNACYCLLPTPRAHVQQMHAAVFCPHRMHMWNECMMLSSAHSMCTCKINTCYCLLSTFSLNWGDSPGAGGTKATSTSYLDTHLFKQREWVSGRHRDTALSPQSPHQPQIIPHTHHIQNDSYSSNKITKC